jgi:hypothetical protein
MKLDNHPGRRRDEHTKLLRQVRETLETWMEPKQNRSLPLLMLLNSAPTLKPSEGNPSNVQVMLFH